MPRKKRDLPAILKEPIRLDRLLAQASKRRRAGSDSRGLLSAELRRRVLALAQYLGKSWPPESEVECEKLVTAICSHFEVVPGFRITQKGAGRKKGWPWFKKLELVVDVQLLRLKNRKRKNYTACRYIAEHPKEYDNRYPRNLRTLYRQFERAEKVVEQFDLDQFDMALVLDPKQEQEFLEARTRIYKNLVEQKSVREKLRNK